MVSNSDSEHSLVALKQAVSDSMPGVEMVMQESPVGDHQANGEAENAVKEVKRMARVLKATLEERIGKNLPVDHPLWTWLPRHAAACLSRYRIGLDGRTAEQRRTGRAWAKATVELGERIHARPAVAQEPRSGLAPKMVEGRYVGHPSRTGSLLAMTETGAIRAKAFNRMQEDERWSSEGLDDLKGAPPAAGSTAPAPIAGSSVPARAPPLAAGAEAAAEVPAPPAGGSAADASGAPGQAGVLRGPPGLAEERPAAKRRVDQMPTALDRAARKRPPEDPPDDPRLETADDDAIAPPAVQAQAAASAGASASSSAVPAAGSPAPAPAAGSSATEGPDVVTGNFSATKEELRRMYESRIVEAYRANCVDLSSSELDDVTQMALELGAVEVPDACPGEHAGRSTPAGNVGLTPGVRMNMECPRPDGTTWDFAREEHISEWFETLEREDPYIVVGWGEEGDGRTPFVRTQTSFMTNLPELAAELRKQSVGGKGGGQPRAQETRVKVILEGGLVRRPHMLTPVLTQCVLRAIRESMGADGEMSDLAAATAGPVPVGPGPFEAGRDNLSDDERYWDDVNGGWLDPQMVREARRLEVEWLHKQDVYEKRTIEECRSVTGQPPIKLMWIDANKGDHEKPIYRSRIVVREKRGKGEEGRADIGDAVENLAKHMQSPRQVDAARLKRLARYLKGRPRVVQKFTRDRSTANDDVVKVLIMVDSDNVGDKVSRRSTVGQVAFVDKHMVKHMCNILQVIGLSSGENEYYAISAGVCTGLGIKGILEDWNVACELKGERSLACAYADQTAEETGGETPSAEPELQTAPGCGKIRAGCKT
ncbi:unnamed protein product, partial [Prorocentrum cordatum]